MTKGGRLQAVIELLDQIRSERAVRGKPADRLVTDYFRARRYAGSKDRRAIKTVVFAILREEGRLSWSLEQVGWTCCGRSLLALFFLSVPEQRDEFGASDHAPEAFTADECAKLDALRALDLTNAPLNVRVEVPDWAVPGFEQRFGSDYQREAQALLQPAGFDLRLNRLKAQTLDEDLLPLFGPIPGVTGGYSRSDDLRLDQHVALREGRIEVQDRAAQIACQLVGVKPGMQVADLCAGAGGKTLALAAVMENKGQIYAFDPASSRLKALKDRVQRAGVRLVQAQKLPLKSNAADTLLAPLVGKMDRVVLDVPCSGVGTWRRSPDLRWRLSANILQDYLKRQSDILARGAALVKPGGRLVYMTCSLLPEENEAVVDAFASSQEGWTRVGLADDLASVTSADYAQANAALNGTDVCLTPARHRSDGFFIAAFDRAPR